MRLWRKKIENLKFYLYTQRMKTLQWLHTKGARIKTHGTSYLRISRNSAVWRQREAIVSNSTIFSINRLLSATSSSTLLGAVMISEYRENGIMISMDNLNWFSCITAKVRMQSWGGKSFTFVQLTLAISSFF